MYEKRVGSNMKDWREACVDKTSTIRDTLIVINQSALKIALIVDHELTLLGTVTDGDIRRAMLDNVSMENSVLEIMNSKPITAKYSDDRKQLTELMERFVLLSIPIISDNNQVIGLVSLHQLVKKIFRLGHLWSINPLIKTHRS